MEIINTHSGAEVSGLTAAAFGFEMNAKMYDILISKMYTNKPGAVIRELSSNAWDAHQAAGKTDVPFLITLPTWLDKTFSIRDFGTGIPHDKFESIYTNVGSSTKEGTNEFIGGFGLGSKTPFTMTDTFMVENWNNGVKTTWVCFKDKGVPQVSKVNEEPSDEPSGLRVEFSFDSTDVMEFTRQVTRQLRYFPVKPIIQGGENVQPFIPLPIGWENKAYFFNNTQQRRDAYTDTDSYVVMGNVCYKMEPSSFDYEYRSLFQAGLTIKVAIGAVDIPPSREHLEMTPKTKAAITTVLDVIKDEYAATVTKELEACTTELEARKYSSTVSVHLLPRNVRENLKWNSIPFSHLYQSSISALAGYSICQLHRTRGNVYKYRQGYLSIQALIENKLTLYINDLGTGYKKHIEDNTSKIPDNVRIIQIPQVPKKEHAAILSTAIIDVTREYGSPPLLLSALIDNVPVKLKGAATQKTEANQVYKLTHDNPSAEGSILACCTEVTGDIPTDGYYVELSGHSPVTVLNNLRQLLYAGIMKVLGKPLYFVRKKTVPKVSKLVLLEASLFDPLKPTLLAKACEQETIWRAYCELTPINKEYLPLLKNLKDKEIRTYIRYATFVQNKVNYAEKDLRSLAMILCGRDALKPASFVDRKKLQPYKDAYYEMNEMLTALTNTYSKERRDARLKALKKLINN